MREQFASLATQETGSRYDNRISIFMSADSIDSTLTGVVNDHG